MSIQIAFKRICLTVLLILTVPKVFGSTYPGDFNVEYDFCNGTIVITWLGYYDCDGSDDDEWNNGNLGMKIGTGSQFTVGTFGDGSGTYTGAWR
jgi:hypothetical protein